MWHLFARSLCSWHRAHSPWCKILHFSLVWHGCGNPSFTWCLDFNSRPVAVSTVLDSQWVSHVGIVTAKKYKKSSWASCCSKSLKEDQVFHRDESEVVSSQNCCEMWLKPTDKSRHSNRNVGAGSDCGERETLCFQRQPPSPMTYLMWLRTNQMANA